MTLILVTPPAAEPVTLAEAKTFLKIEHDDEDTLIGTLIAAARLHVEAATRRVLVLQSWRLVLDGWPPRRLVEVPLSPVASVDAITVYDGEGEPAVLDPAGYVADVTSSPARILVRGTVAPEATFNGIEIDLTAGYGETDDVPAPLRQAVLQLAAHWYERREPVAFGGSAQPAPLGFEALIAPYRVRSL